jgi:hypothetical protein
MQHRTTSWLGRSAAVWLWTLLVPAAALAAEGFDLLRLKNGREVSIRVGWQASFSEGTFEFEYVSPRHLGCTMPLEDVVEIETADGTIYQNTYVPPRITYSNRAVLNVTGTIVQHGSRYENISRDRVNGRGWNSRTGRYE